MRVLLEFLFHIFQKMFLMRLAVLLLSPFVGILNYVTMLQMDMSLCKHQQCYLFHAHSDVSFCKILLFTRLVGYPVKRIPCHALSF